MARRKLNSGLVGALAVSMLVTIPATRAAADFGDAVKVIGAICLTNPQLCKIPQRGGGGGNSGNVAKPNSGISQAQRQQNRDVQNALNTFNFPVGQADGFLGRRSRAAISDYQRYLGYPATGYLTQWERDTLMNTWRKYQAGASSAYPRAMAAEGPRAMLRIEQNPEYARKFGDGADRQPYPPVQPAPEFDPQPKTPGPLPIIPRAEEPVRSVAARCELVVATSKIQGDTTHNDHLSDPHQALSEKLCEARGLAITQGQSAQARLPASEAELTGICEQIRDAFSGPVGQMQTAPVEAVLRSAQEMNATLGLTDPQVTRDYGEICTGMGYRMDDAGMALAGALSLTASGQLAYAELIGHHLREGFGTSEAPAAATEWYATALKALENGGRPVFMASSTQERIILIRQAMQRTQNGIALPGEPAESVWKP